MEYCQVFKANEEASWIMSVSKTYLDQQMQLCLKHKVDPVDCPHNLKAGVANNIRDTKEPINGLRINPSNETTGWYIWAGEWSDDPNFFQPLHVEHLSDWCPLVVRYLQLPPGWRFLATDGYEDVWFDPDLEL